MKKLLFLVISVSLFFVACKQKDTQPPMIFLNGSDPMNVTLNSWWTDPGCTVDDNVDGSSLINAIEVTHNIPINGPANGEGTTTLEGTYTVTYTVTDKAGNTNTATRTVKVVNSAEKYATSYVQKVDATNEDIVKDTIFPNAVTLTYDNRINYRIYFPKLGGFINPQHNTLRIYADIQGAHNDSVVVPAQYNAFTENGVRYLYIISGVLGESKVLDTIDPYIKVKYKIDKLVWNQTQGTVQWSGDSLWKQVKTDIVIDTYERY